jgi:hypothetical protein
MAKKAKKARRATKKAPAKKPGRKKKTARVKRETPRNGGRASLLTPEVQDRICDIMRRGNFIETAAASVGIHQSTLRRWLARGRREMQRLDLEPYSGPKESELPFLRFCEAVDMAEAEAEVAALDLLSAHSFEDWRSIAWRLERKSFNRWGRRQAIEHSGPDGGPVKVQRLQIGDKVIEF